MPIVTIPNTRPFFTTNSVSRILYLKIEKPKEKGIARTVNTGRINNGLIRNIGLFVIVWNIIRYIPPKPPIMNPF